MPTLIDLAGLPPFNHNSKGEPPLQGRSLAPLVLRGGGSSGSSGGVMSGCTGSRSSAAGTIDDLGFNASYSQYGRSRCPDDLFIARCSDPEANPAGTFH